MKLLSKLTALAAVLLAMTSPLAAHNGVHVYDPYARVINGAGVVYFMIGNHEDQPDTLLSAFCPDAGMVQLMNASTDANGVRHMTAVTGGFTVAAGSTRLLKGAADHVMLMAMARPLKTGDTLTLVLLFQNAGEVRVTVPVDNKRRDDPTMGPTAFDAESADRDRGAEAPLKTLSTLPASTVPAGLTPDQTPDQTAIVAVMTAQFAKPDAPVSAGPVVVMGDDAVASWAQGDTGGRVLLARENGHWRIVLRGGADLRMPAFLAANGVQDAAMLSQMFNAAEDGLGADKVMLSSKFPAVVMMSAPAAPSGPAKN